LGGGLFGFKDSPLLGANIDKEMMGGSGFIARDSFLKTGSFVPHQTAYSSFDEVLENIRFMRAGPFEKIFIDPSRVKAAIVTCGGLCPGLNTVIRGLVMTLNNYKINTVYGIRWGYKGFYTDKEKNWTALTPEVVKNIHKQGGTILGSSRGGFEAEKILDSLKESEINMVFVIGGDGTHRGIDALIKAAIERGQVIQIIGVPKTIDNDIPLIDNSFGYNTSVEVAARMVERCQAQATSVKNGVGLIKVMGRYSGFIAMGASLTNNEVDFCLIPELPFEILGENGVMTNIVKRVQKQGSCLVVVAEGAEEGMINQAESITANKAVDGSGNQAFDDIGEALEKLIPMYGKQYHQIDLNVVYIDPTYAIRSVRSNATDTLLCTKLA